MRQELFESKHQETWTQFEESLARLEKKKALEPGDKAFPQAYRQLCKQLALARDRGYSAHIVDRLNRLVLRGHHLMYSVNDLGLMRIIVFFSKTFPQMVRKEFRLVLLCSLLFYGSGIAVFTAVRLQPQLAYSILSPSQLDSMVEMHHPQLKKDRTIAEDMGMFGYYVWNNTGISFRTFASGLLAGIGSLFFLIFNGLIFGCVAAHLSVTDASSSFFSFVVGHAAFELTAIVLSAAAGLRLGLAILTPGLLTRSQALREAGKTAIVIVYGLASMMVIAAIIEAFWSPRLLDYSIKYGFGLFTWSLVTLYFLRMGRQHAH